MGEERIRIESYDMPEGKFITKIIKKTTKSYSNLRELTGITHCNCIILLHKPLYGEISIFIIVCSNSNGFV